jgi:hypothetical protein
MSVFYRINQLRETLTGLGVKSPELAGKADEPLKPILVDSVEYHKLRDRMTAASEKFERIDKNALTFFVVLFIVSAVYWFFNRHRDFAPIDILLGGIAVVCAIVFVITWRNDYVQSRITSKETEKFVAKWVERVQADPIKVTRLEQFNQALQACEAALQKRRVGGVAPDREKTVDYVLLMGSDAEPALIDYFSAVDGSTLDWTVRAYLTGNPFLYALMYRYRPGRFLGFIEACHARYREDPFSLNTEWIENAFDRHIVRA